MNMEGKLHAVRELDSLKELLEQGASYFGECPAFLAKEKKGGKYFEISFNQFKKDVEALGTKLLEMGLEGEKIAVMGNNCYQWIVAYFAIVTGVGVAVPLDKELKQQEIHNLLKAADCKAVFYTSNFEKYFADYDIDYKFTMDPYQVEENMTNDNHIYSLIFQGRGLLNAGRDEFVNKQIDTKAMSVILFTSGTTGNPKGVMLSHENLCHVIKATSQIVKLKEGDRTLSVLPIHHTFESTIGIMVVLFQGGSITFYEGLKYVLKNMQEAKASIIVGVPLIIESIYNKIWKEAEKTGKAGMLRTAVKLNKTLQKIGIDKREKIFKSVRKNFGGNFRLVICGAAAMNPAVLRGFVDLGFDLSQGYGLTETAPLVAGVPDFENIYKKAGSCGPAIPGVEIKIDNPDSDGIGEILIKGPNVMLGYYKMPEETAKVIKDGWFYSGDLGFLDKDGWLYITGRAKNVIVTKTGKNIYPEEIEVLVNDIKYVEDSMVYGMKEEHGEEYYVAVQIKPDMEAIKEDKGDLSDKEVYELFKDLIYEINKNLVSYKRIKKIQIRKEDFVRTTTKKIKRQDNI